MSFFCITSVATVRSVVCDKSMPATPYVSRKSFRSKCLPLKFFSISCVFNQAELDDCFRQQYFQMNSLFFESDCSATEISDNM